MFREVYTVLRIPGKGGGGKFVPVLVPLETHKVDDIMINEENLMNGTYCFQAERDNCISGELRL